ncbi:Zinc finger, RING-type [Corchorus olitorius]|uniref:RING-type E3 ubiquitin transferase n=1 Tax=Corchorus olitorius TaxID=93759 RepID=A0A1R3K6H4_9ROSI|nr:Zinc finger, RING-type [Corchorus olitorius]
MESSSSSRKSKFIKRVISPAIIRRKCPICLRDLKPRVAAATVLSDCFHSYCLDCIRKWSDLKRECHVCRSTFHS